MSEEATFFESLLSSFKDVAHKMHVITDAGVDVVDQVEGFSIDNDFTPSQIDEMAAADALVCATCADIRDEAITANKISVFHIHPFYKRYILRR